MIDRRINSRYDGRPVRDFLSAAEAARELAVSLPTLYAYVSRGLIRSEAESGSRRRRYVAEDVWLLKERKQTRRDPAKTARDALYWGLPVLESRLSVIHGGRLYYRGRDVVDLARSCRIEQVASLLWSGDLEAPFPDDLVAPEAREWKLVAELAAALPPLDALQLFLPLACASDRFAFDVRPAAVRRAGARILRLLAAAAVVVRPSRHAVAEVLQR